MKKIQWFPERKVDGVLRIPASRVDQSATRGIIFDRPERYVVSTPYGQAEIGAGDWLVIYPSGNMYVMKDEDMTNKLQRATIVHRIVQKIRMVCK